MALSETWLRNHKELLDYVAIEGYVTEFHHCEVTKGGGVGAYIKDNIPYKRRYDIENTQPGMEHLWLELPGRNKHSKLLLGVIYRSNLVITASNWLECFEDLLTHVTSNWDGMVVLAGDTNFNLLALPDRLAIYNTILDIFGLDQIVTKPTIVTKTSQTLIDHIITNYPSQITSTNVIPTAIVSDHDALFACINVRVDRFQPRYKFIRNLKKLNEQDFINDFHALPVASCNLFSECLEKHVPLRRVQITTPPAPWMEDSQIRSLQQQHNILRKEAHQTGTQFAGRVRPLLDKHYLPISLRKCGVLYIAF